MWYQQRRCFFYFHRFFDVRTDEAMYPTANASIIHLPDYHFHLTPKIKSKRALLLSTDQLHEFLNPKKKKKKKFPCKTIKNPKSKPFSSSRWLGEGRRMLGKVGCVLVFLYFFLDMTLTEMIFFFFFFIMICKKNDDSLAFAHVNFLAPNFFFFSF